MLKLEILKKPLIILFFVTQIVLVFYNLNKEAKFFNWAMYHTRIYYTASVTVNGIELNDKEFMERYKISRKGGESRDLGMLKRKMVKRETIYHSGDKVSIELNYTENTHKGIWTWKN